MYATRLATRLASDTDFCFLSPDTRKCRRFVVPRDLSWRLNKKTQHLYIEAIFFWGVMIASSLKTLNHSHLPISGTMFVYTHTVDGQNPAPLGPKTCFN